MCADVFAYSCSVPAMQKREGESEGERRIKKHRRKKKEIRRGVTFCRGAADMQLLVHLGGSPSSSPFGRHPTWSSNERSELRHTKWDPILFAIIPIDSNPTVTDYIVLLVLYIQQEMRARRAMCATRAVSLRFSFLLFILILSRAIVDVAKFLYR